MATLRISQLTFREKQKIFSYDASSINSRLCFVWVVVSNRANRTKTNFPFLFSHMLL